MSNGFLCRAVRTVRNATRTYSPEILTGLSIAGTILAVIFSVDGTVKAVKAVEEKKEELGVDELGKKEIVKLVWPYYIPTGISLATSIGCEIGANRIMNKRTTAIATAYSLAETALSEQKEITEEIVGKKKSNEIEDKAVQKHVDKNPVSDAEILCTGNGNTLFWDDTFQRYFRSDADYITQKLNQFSEEIAVEWTLPDCFSAANHHRHVSVNELFNAIGVPPIDPMIGDQLGWYRDDLEGCRIADLIRLGSALDEENNPCRSFMLDYPMSPMWLY